MNAAHDSGKMRLWPSKGNPAHGLCTVTFGNVPDTFTIYQVLKQSEELRKRAAAIARFWLACHYASAYFDHKAKGKKGWCTGDILACRNGIAKLPKSVDSELAAAKAGKVAAGGLVLRHTDEEE